MAYIPPHKRHSKGGAASSPPSPALPPEPLIPRFQRNLNFKSKDHPEEIGYINEWFVVGVADETRVSDLTRLEPAAIQCFRRKTGEPLESLALVLKENGEEVTEFSPNPWIYVTETVKQDLIASLEQVKNEMSDNEFRIRKPTLVVRFGRILFHGTGSFTAESMKGSSLPVGALEQLWKSFYTNIPPSYMEYVTSNVVPKINSELFKEKELYYVHVSDNKRPGLIISCKCTVAKETNQLKLYKMMAGKSRHLVADMSCLNKNLDVRLSLFTNTIYVAFPDEKLENIKSLINSAILDSEVKGGLRWPLGKQSSGNRFTVAAAWHTNAKTFSNSSVKIEVRHADRFHFRYSNGDVANEINLKMPGVLSLLREETFNTGLAIEMLKENLKLIWNHFLF